jgi:hypothetical protein
MEEGGSVQLAVESGPPYWRPCLAYPEAMLLIIERVYNFILEKDILKHGVFNITTLYIKW